MKPLTTADVFNLAAEGFDLPPLGFMPRLSAGLVERAGLKPGDAVLDVGCGTGSAAIPAARQVRLAATATAAGEPGTVTAVDLAENMVARAREKAAAAGVPNAFFTVANVLEWTPPVSFDAILAAFSVFHVPDPEALIARFQIWSKPSGRWACSFWGEGFRSEFKHLLREETARCVPGFQAPPGRADLYNTAPKIEALLAGPGRRVELEFERRSWPLSAPADWWTLARFTSDRRFVDAVPPERLVEFRDRLLRRAEQECGLELDLPVYFARVVMDAG